MAVLDPLYQEFSDNLIRGLIDNITVYSKSRIVVTFKSGYDLLVLDDFGYSEEVNTKKKPMNYHRLFEVVD